MSVLLVLPFTHKKKSTLKANDEHKSWLLIALCHQIIWSQQENIALSSYETNGVTGVSHGYVSALLPDDKV